MEVSARSLHYRPQQKILLDYRPTYTLLPTRCRVTKRLRPRAFRDSSVPRNEDFTVENRSFHVNEKGVHHIIVESQTPLLAVNEEANREATGAEPKAESPEAGSTKNHVNESVDSGYAILLESSLSPTKDGPRLPWELPVAFTSSLAHLIRLTMKASVTPEFKFSIGLAIARERFRRIMIQALESIHSSQHMFLMLLGVAWYAAGASLLGKATFHVSIFMPESSELPWMSVMLAVQRAAQGFSEFVLHGIANMFLSFTYARLPMKIFLSLLSAVPLVLIFGPLYKYFANSTWTQAFVKIHSITNRFPGANMVSEPNMAAYVVANIAYFAGLFTFAVFLGIVSDEVNHAFRAIRVAGYNLDLQGHTLVLNWSTDAMPLLKQFDMGLRFSEDAFFQRPIVILAMKDKSKLDEEVSSNLQDSRLELYTRHGNPTSPKDLAMVSAKHASTVIVLHPDHATTPEAAEAWKAATAMALGVDGSDRHQNVVFQRAASVPQDSDYLQALTIPIAATAEGSSRFTLSSSSWNSLSRQQRHQGAHKQVLKLLTMPDRIFKDRICAQSSVQPGMLRVWQKILLQGPSSFKLRLIPLPEGYAGGRYIDVRRSFQDCVVIGIMRRGQVNLLPDDDQRMIPADKLVVFSYVTHPRVKPWMQQSFRDASVAAAQRLAQKSTLTLVEPRKIIVPIQSEDRERLQDLIQCFADATPEGSNVTFIVDHVPSSGLKPIIRLGNCHFNFLEARNPMSMRVLREAGIKEADSVVLTWLVDKKMPTLEADAVMLSAVLQVQSAVSASGRIGSPHIIAKVHHSSTNDVMKQYFASTHQEEGAHSAPVLDHSNSHSVNPPFSQAVGTGWQYGQNLKHNFEIAKVDRNSSNFKPFKKKLKGKRQALSEHISKQKPELSSEVLPVRCSNTVMHGGSSVWEFVIRPIVSLHRLLHPSSTAFSELINLRKVELLLQPLSTLQTPSLHSSISNWFPHGSRSSGSDSSPNFTNHEVFMPDNLRAALLAQVASEPDMTAIICRLLATQEDTEFYLHNPAAHNIATGDTVTFAEVAETGRLLKHTAVGYLLSGGRLVMAPEPMACHTFQDGDQIIVLAQDYKSKG